jgi:hypothetical protein
MSAIRSGLRGAVYAVVGSLSVALRAGLPNAPLLWSIRGSSSATRAGARRLFWRGFRSSPKGYKGNGGLVRLFPRRVVGHDASGAAQALTPRPTATPKETYLVVSGSSDQ